ncbi:MAG: hypothetical protein SPE21_02455 [Candidatus Cryptobacteroides sp.]|nr:hypothetical protein [Candidatus Cryptobacteroides sp.]
MKKRIIILFAILAAFALSSCVEENLREGTVGDKIVPVNLSFGTQPFGQVEVNTKATIGIIPESRVSNMFLFIFVDGKRYYAHYFDSSDLVPTIDVLEKSYENCWLVDQRTSDADVATNGTMHLFAPVLTGGTLYAIANIDADMVNISPEKINVITTEAQLLELTASLNQEITSRNGLFPMTAKLENIIINKTGIKTGSGGSAKINLERVDAKVMVNLRVDKGYKSVTTDESGTETTTQTLKEFRPESWRVVNIPKGSYVLPRNADMTTDYFSTSAVAFETTETKSFTSEKGTTYSTEVHGFSFYMLENRPSSKKSVDGNYHLRDRRVKDLATGEYALDSNGEMWEYAPESGTYLEIKGEVVMDVDVSSDAKQQQLAADVTYYIHLGDIASSRDNYSIERNTIYTYNIVIKGVTNIELEVRTSSGNLSELQENESGATGAVYVAKESIFTFDAHYGQRVFCFDSAYIEPDNVTWYVKTPFGKEGVPDKIGDTEIPSGLDYKWVHFLPNRISSDATYTYNGNTYTYSGGTTPFSHNNMPWPGDPDDGVDYKFYESTHKLVSNGVEHGLTEADLMDVLGFTAYIKDQKRRLDAGQTNDFRVEFDPEWLEWYNDNHPGAEVTDPSSDPNGVWFRKRIYMTVFVDEFFYEEHPFTPDVPKSELWKSFVNQPNRLMHILCDANLSFDKESSATGSVITIRQRSIQTPYNVEKADLTSGWGCETEDETLESCLFFFNTNETLTKTPSEVTEVTASGNNSMTNGLYNSACLWGLISGGSFVSDVPWSDFVTFDRENDFEYSGSDSRYSGYVMGFLNDDKSVLRYAPLVRNRDNNGNGKIDPEEIRWYIASIDQLYGLYVGGMGLNSEAQLYTIEDSNQDTTPIADGPYQGAYKWRRHIVASTNYNSNNMPYVLWAEEGVSTGPYAARWEKYAPYSIRCVRNFGIDDATSANIATESANMPVPLLNVIKPDDPVTPSSVYYFDLSNVNEKSMRFYTSRDLEPANEFSEMSRVYDGFETGEVVTLSSNQYSDLKASIEGNIQVCPDGYRVPNVREGALMSLNCDAGNWWSDAEYSWVSSAYSNGLFGNNKDPKNLGSWVFKQGFMTINTATNHVRCVRDWNP